MPLMSCNKDGKPGYKYGESGACYVYTEGNEESRKKAKHSAIIQGTAISHNSGEKLELSKEDWEELRKEIEEDGGDLEPLIKDDENNCIFGWGYVALRKDGSQVVDHSEDFVKPENIKDLEIGTYAFNLAYREGDIRHTSLDTPPTGFLIESMVFTNEKMEKMRVPKGILPEGVWFGFYFPDDKDYQMIKAMKKPMFSLFGKVQRDFVDNIDMLKEKGLGRMGGPESGGPDGNCVCPECKTKVAHKTGEPCYDISCPKCGTKMTREEV